VELPQLEVRPFSGTVGAHGVDGEEARAAARMGRSRGRRGGGADGEEPWPKGRRRGGSGSEKIRVKEGLLRMGIFVCCCGPHETVERVTFFLVR
jgi:hypothetical protein